MKPIVRVEGLSKQYQIAVRKPADDPLAETDLPKSRSMKLSRHNGDLHYETIWALKDVRFDVKPGEALGIVGRNGAGKSTLLKILSRITKPTSGRVDLYGRVGSLLEVGTGFHPELTGRENVYLNGAILGMKRSEIYGKFDEIIEFSEIKKFIDTPIKWYSSGMYMRLAFAVAVNFEPEILIVDEVLAVGDTDFQKKCLAKMRDISSAGRTVIFVSHNMNAVEQLCDRVLWLVDGEVVEKEETEKVVSDYVNTIASVSTEKVWDDPAIAPGNEMIKLHSARLRSPAHLDSGHISVDSPIELEFEFWNYQANGAFRAIIYLLTVDGVHVFSAASEKKPRPQGLIRETITIPAPLLNAGMYTISVQLLRQGITVLNQSDVLVFQVVDAIYQGKWPGVIKPRLKWVSQDITENGGFQQ